MATDKVVIEAQKLESCRAGYADTSIQVKILQVPAKCGPITAVPPPPTAAGVTNGDSVSGIAKVLPTGHAHHPASATVTVQSLQAPSPSVMVIAKVATPGGVSANNQLQVTKPTLRQVASMSHAATPGRTVMITVPRAAAPQTVAVAPRLQQTASPQLPANIQIPSGELHHISVVHIGFNKTDVFRFGHCYILNAFYIKYTEC